MSVSNLKVGARAALVALALLVAGSQIAQAETIFLNCSPMSTITVDLTNRTVNGIPARITPIAIDWIVANQYGENHIHIDRSTGILTGSASFKTGAHVETGPYACTVTSAPSTKF